jgi:hypothetical protein
MLPGAVALLGLVGLLGHDSRGFLALLGQDDRQMQPISREFLSRPRLGWRDSPIDGPRQRRVDFARDYICESARGREMVPR